VGTHSEAALIYLTSERAHEAWYPPLKPEHASPDRFALHDFAARHLGTDSNIRYLEFGVHSRFWRILIIECLSPDNDSFYGFGP
jgi:hypothetical protein